MGHVYKPSTWLEVCACVYVCVCMFGFVRGGSCVCVCVCVSDMFIQRRIHTCTHTQKYKAKLIKSRCVCCVCVYVCNVCVTCTYSSIDMYPSIRTYKYSYTNLNETRAIYVMFARASTTSLRCAQSPKPLSDALVNSNSGGGPKEDCWNWDE